MSPRRISRMLAVVGCVVVAACTFGSTGSAEEAVHEFHRRFSAQAFGEVYSESDQAMQETTSEEGLTDFLQSLHEKLGPVQETRRTGWHVNVGAKGRIVTLQYETDFANGHGSEQFIFRLHGEKARLQGYHVSAPVLITK